MESCFINLFKPIGLSSFDCIQRLRRILGIKKIGHTGTLDPLADGVLPIAVGSATRLIEYLEKVRKTYRSVFQLGLTTDTDDIEGLIIDRVQVEPVPVEKIEEALRHFHGEISQVPPAVSAIHVNGKRAYQLARAGKTVELSPRKVRIYSIKLLSYAYPNLELEIDTGPGTYIRSIARDLGKALGMGAIVKSLRRTRSGAFRIEDSVTFEQIDEYIKSNLPAKIFADPLEVLGNIPRVVVNENGYKDILHGRKVSTRDVAKVLINITGENDEPDEEPPEETCEYEKSVFIAVDPMDRILAVLRFSDEESFITEKVLIRSDREYNALTEECR